MMNRHHSADWPFQVDKLTDVFPYTNLTTRIAPL